QIAELTRPAVKSITVRIDQGQGREGILTIPESARPQQIPGRALGGPIVGGVPGRDSVPIMAMPGEHMLTTSDVAKLGGQHGVYRFRAALQAGLVRGFAGGGAVGWSQKDEIDLQQAQTAVVQAQEQAAKVEADK